MSKWSSYRRSKEESEPVNHHRDASGLVKVISTEEIHFCKQKVVIRKPQIRMSPKSKQGRSTRVFFTIGR